MFDFVTGLLSCIVFVMIMIVAMWAIPDPASEQYSNRSVIYANR